MAINQICRRRSRSILIKIILGSTRRKLVIMFSKFRSIGLNRLSENGKETRKDVTLVTISNILNVLRGSELFIIGYFSWKISF